jgi:hypothetical protein
MSDIETNVTGKDRIKESILSLRDLEHYFEEKGIGEYGSNDNNPRRLELK